MRLGGLAVTQAWGPGSNAGAVAPVRKVLEKNEPEPWRFAICYLPECVAERQQSAVCCAAGEMQLLLLLCHACCMLLHMPKHKDNLNAGAA